MQQYMSSRPVLYAELLWKNTLASVAAIKVCQIPHEKDRLVDLEVPVFVS